MIATFLDSSGKVLFIRGDMEEGHWSRQEMNVTASFPFDHEKKIETGQRIAFHDPVDDSLQAFEVKTCTNIEPDHYQQITAENIAISELSDEHIDRLSITGKTAAEAISGVLSGTIWEIGNDTSSGVQDADINRGSVWDAVITIQQNWNVYITPRIEISETGTISGRYLDIAPATGIWRGLRLSIRKNLLDPSVVYDDSEVYTALYAYGGTVDKPRTGQDDQQEELTFADEVWSATSDHPAKPAGQTYLEWPEKTALYGRNGRPRFGYYQNGNIKNAGILLQKTWESLKQCCEPKIQISGGVIDLYRLGYKDQPINLHDLAIVEIEETGEMFYKQIICCDVDLIDPTGTRVDIGDYIPNIIYINRDINNKASGGRSGGRSPGSLTDLQDEISDFDSEFIRDRQSIGMIVGQKDGNKYIKAATIIASINDDGTTGALIHADKIVVEGDTVLTTALSEIRSEVWAADSSAHSAIMQTASAIRAEVSAGNSALYSEIEQTASQIRSTVASVDSNLKSEIRQTASAIYLQVGKKAQVFHQYTDPVLTEDVSESDFWVMDSGIRTYGEAGDDTWGDLASYTWGDFFGSIIYVRDGDEWVPVGGDQLSEISNGKIEITDEFIRAWKESGIDFAGIMIEQNRITSRVASVELGLTSVIEQTASMIRSAVFTANSAMYSEIMQTQSMIRSEVANAESNLSSEINQTASSIMINVNRKSAVWFQQDDPRNNIPAPTINRNDVWIQSNMLNTYGEAGLHTWAELGQYTWMEYYGSKMFGWDGQEWQPISDDQKANYDFTLLQQTQEALVSVKGDLSGAYSRITQTKTELQSIIEDRASGLRSSILQTASEIRLEVTNKTNSLSSMISQTAIEIRTEVDNKAASLSSSISQTASQIRTEVNNKTSSLQSSISQQADRISLVVQGTGSNASIRAAQIVASINNSGSSVMIDANRIRLGNGALFSQLATGVQCNKAFTANRGLYVINSAGTYAIDLRKVLTFAEIENNTLILKNGDGTVVQTFSKAVSLLPTWNGATLSVKARQENGGVQTDVATSTVGFGGQYGDHDIELAVMANGTPTIYSESSKILNVPVYVGSMNSGSAQPTSRYMTNVRSGISSLLQWKSVSSNGDVEPDSGYIGLSKVTVSVSDPHPTRFTLSCTEATPVYPGSNIKNYTFTMQSAYSFSSGSNYYFYR